MAWQGRAVLFDLGGTLMDPRAPWPPVLDEADRALHQELEAFSIYLEKGRFRESLRQYHAVRDKELHETTYHLVLREVVEQAGYAEVSERIIRRALDAMFRVTQENWALRPGASAALQSLRASGYRLAVLSNAGDDQDVQDLVTKFGIRSLFDFVLTSAACGYRKPHARIFELALARWTLDPTEAAMVGDTLEADVLGAQRVGIYGIWLAPPGAEQPAQAAASRAADATLRSLSEINDHLRSRQR